ncbi:MAG TPA: hypothetical protein VHB21_27815 [Minicystis sp.]|nr:hypothetical protein [Minicystis sp.]
MNHLSLIVRAALVACAVAAAGCGSDQGFKAETPKMKAQRNPDGSINDGSRCEWKGRADREASEVAGPGSVQPNVRRVYQIVGTGDDRHKVLVCREIDTNFDGVKDVFRTYNDKGEPLHEEADANYDGKIDTWITFAKGRLAEVRMDHNGDGNPDEWKYYSAGKLSRIKRDTNFDGKPDVWEMYRDDHLERMGVDVDGDEHVDRWDHDTDAKRKLDAEDRKKEEAAAAAHQKEMEAINKANYAAADTPPADNTPKSKRTKKKPAGATPAPAPSK